MTNLSKAAFFHKAAASLILALAASSSIAAPIPLTNAGFETSYVGAGYTYLGGNTVNGWTYVGRTGIAGNGSAFGVSQAPGNQAAFIQSDGSSISQSFDFTGGIFTVDFLAEYRRGYGGNTISVMVDNRTLSFGGVTAFAPATGADFTRYLSDAISLSAGTHTLTFTGYSLPDYTTFIDDVRISAVPEPASLGLFALGALGFAGRRRRKA